jgi:hypothetical protein
MRKADLLKFVELYELKKQHEGDAKELGEKIEKLEARLLKQFTDAGVSKITVNGRTLWVDRKLWAGAKDGNTARAIKALRAAKLGEFCNETLNVQGLSAYVRERDDSGETPVPEKLANAISVTEKYNVRVRKAQ